MKKPPVWLKKGLTQNATETVPRKRIFVGTPAYEGKVYVQYAMMLLDLQKILEMHGYQVNIRLPVGGSLLVSDRNRILQMFWESGDDYLLCLDSDLAFNPNYILQFIEQMNKTNKDFIGGVYPSRDGKGFNFRPSLEEDSKIVQCKETGLLQMQYIPAGCMFMTRNLIGKLRDHFPELHYKPKEEKSDASPGVCLFDTQVWEGEFWGEDYVFCRRVREAGFDIWINPTIVFNHAGVHGSLMQTLTNKKEESVK
jgi:hypothetical protein